MKGLRNSTTTCMVLHSRVYSVLFAENTTQLSTFWYQYFVQSMSTHDQMHTFSDVLSHKFAHLRFSLKCFISQLADRRLSLHKLPAPGHLRTSILSVQAGFSSAFSTGVSIILKSSIPLSISLHAIENSRFHQGGLKGRYSLISCLWSNGISK